MWALKAPHSYGVVVETNIKQHFVEYVEAYVNCAWKKDFLVEKIRRMKNTKREREAGIRKLCTTLRHLKNDLLNVGSEPYQSHESYHGWIRGHKQHVLPSKQRYEKDLLYYDLQCSPPTQPYYLSKLP
jgi:hypothetical protein